MHGFSLFLRFILCVSMSQGHILFRFLQATTSAPTLNRCMLLYKKLYFAVTRFLEELGNADEIPSGVVDHLFLLESHEVH